MSAVFDSLPHSNAAALILDSALESFVILAMAGGVCLCLRRASAATRHLIWFLSVACLPLLPLFSSLLPAWQKPLWSVSAGVGGDNQFSVALEFTPVVLAATSIDQTRVSNTTSAALPFTSGRQLAAQFSVNWIVLAFFAWSGGALLTLGSILAAKRRVRQLERRSQALRSGDWTELLRELCRQWRIRRPVTLLQCTESVMPSTWGTRRPRILLPMEFEQWLQERQRVVLLHELAHVRRWDCWTQTITDLICALYWFNPLVWLAAHRMRVERERACDDMVLNIGCKASDYAGHLVDIARSFRRLPPTTAIAMTRSSALGGRVAAIMDASHARGMHPITVAAVAVLAGGTILAVGGCSWCAVTTRSASMLQSGDSVRLGDVSIFAEKVHSDGTNLENVIVSSYERNGRLEGLMEGTTGTISSDPAHQQIILRLQNMQGMHHYSDGWKPIASAGEATFPLKVESQAQKIVPLPVSDLTLRQLLDARVEFERNWPGLTEKNAFNRNLLEWQRKLRQTTGDIPIRSNGALESILPRQKQESPP